MTNLHNTYKPNHSVRESKSKTTEYKHVKEIYNVRDGSTYFRAERTIKSQKFSFWGKTARAVALELDKKLIAKGFEPVNILKRK